MNLHRIPSLENDRLLRACCRNDFGAVRWLLDQRDLHPIDLKRGINRSVLHEAVLHSNSQLLVRLLCQHGADPRQRDSLGLYKDDLNLCKTKFKLIV